MGLLAAIVVAVGVVACSGNGDNKENKEGNENNSYANFRTEDNRESRNNQAVRNERPANNDNKIVGRWKCTESELGSMTIVFNRDNTGYAELSYSYGWYEPYNYNSKFSYRYDDRRSEVTVAIEGYRSDFETNTVEWFGDNRFYLIDNYGYKVGPFVRQ